jgi:hypothetical protein
MIDSRSACARERRPGRGLAGQVAASARLLRGRCGCPALLNAHGFFYSGLRLRDDPQDHDFLGLQARAIPAQGEHRLELASDPARALHAAIFADESRGG